jgi:regulator of sigma E protease
MSAESLSGPMGIGHMSGQITMGAAASADAAGVNWLAGAGHVLVSLLLFSAVLSVSVGLINLAPIPVLDGGHLMFYAVEAVSGKPVSEGVQAFGYRFGLACVLALFVFATFNDLQRLGVFGFVGRLFS